MKLPDPSMVRAPTAVIAEDESLLADELIEMLSMLWPQLRIVERTVDGVTALGAVESHAPDILFLDIRMPLLNGIEVARHVGGRCHLVFITSYDEHAIDAFEAGAVDYVLKPPTLSRLMKTVERLKARIQQPPLDPEQALRRYDALRPVAPRYLQWINASRGTAVRLITVEEILYFHSDQKYTRVVTVDAESLIRKTIKELTGELDPTMFWQVHRSVVVNVHAIDSVVRDERGNLSLRLKQRRESLPVSEAYHHLFRQM